MDAKIRSFQRKILTFYRENKRQLPWRQTTDPYHILISEIMLQQTQVDRVISYYTKWLKQWPSIGSLARAKRSEVLTAWSGLGYNNRAINLHKTAQIISERFSGNVLDALKHYKELPGIGPYTAHAVEIFSTNADTVAVDTNIRRIFIHEFTLSESISDNELWSLAEKSLPKGKSRDWHNALMDYGATFLTSRKTGIRPKTRQSTFEGSDRQVRSSILKTLLHRKTLPLANLSSTLGCEEKRLENILRSMQRDDLIIRGKTNIQLKE